MHVFAILDILQHYFASDYKVVYVNPKNGQLDAVIEISSQRI